MLLLTYVILKLVFIYTSLTLPALPPTQQL